MSAWHAVAGTQHCLLLGAANAAPNNSSVHVSNCLSRMGRCWPCCTGSHLNSTLQHTAAGVRQYHSNTSRNGAVFWCVRCRQTRTRPNVVTVADLTGHRKIILGMLPSDVSGDEVLNMADTMECSLACRVVCILECRHPNFMTTANLTG